MDLKLEVKIRNDKRHMAYIVLYWVYMRHISGIDELYETHFGAKYVVKLGIDECSADSINFLLIARLVIIHPVFIFGIE